MSKPTSPAPTEAREPASHYDSVVDAWGHLLGEDLHYGYFHNGGETLESATDALTNEMLALADLKAGEQVLDVGCGTGKSTCRMAREHSAGVTGISTSRACITAATARADQQGLAELANFCLGDGTNLAFEDSSFDCAWVMESSHLMDKKPALLRECSRVLRPGGRLVLCDIMLERKLSLEEVIDFRDEFLLLKDVFGRARMETLEFYQQQCKENELRVTHARPITNETHPTFDRWRSNGLQNRDQVSQLIGEAARDQFLASCDVLERFWDQGILGYGIVAASKP
jgi:27-O-demethylrifamycin SV methyltransferase